MVDRVIVYPGALPQTLDILSTNKFGMVGQAYLNRAVLGTNTVVSGLPCTATSPTADLHVNIGVGSIYQMDPPDTAAYGDLGSDTATSIMKQGILGAPVALTITPPATAGFSQVFLVQAELQDVDAGQLVLSYYNSANPASPFSGPANSGTSNFTVRTNPCTIALKAGVAATTGTQVAPTADVGFVGLYNVTVVNGQTQITSTSIASLVTAPTFPTLPAVPPAIQNGSWIYCVDTGALNALVITPSPNVSALVAGMGFRVKVLVTNTLTSTITINYVNSSGVASTLGPTTIHRGSGAGVAAGDLTSGSIVDLVYDGVFFQMANYLGSGTNTNTNTTSLIPYVADSGVANALVGTYSPVITSGQQVAGLFISIKLANTITGACTINVNGLGLKNVLLGDLTAPPFNLFVAGQILLLVYDGTQYQIVSGANQAMARKAPVSFTLYVNGAIGNDANDGLANTAGHALLTIQGGLNKAFTYAPGQYTITILIAPGTYIEHPVSPTWQGPPIVIDGQVATNVTISAGSNGVALGLYGPNSFIVQNLSIQNNGVYTNTGVYSAYNSLVTCNNVHFNSCGCPYGTAFGGNMTVSNSVFNSSASYTYYNAGGQGTITIGTGETFTTSVSVGYATVYSTGGIINASGAVWVNPGFVSGVQWISSLNGVVDHHVTYPGTIAGFTQTGGQ